MQEKMELFLDIQKAISQLEARTGMENDAAKAVISKRIRKLKNIFTGAAQVSQGK